MATVNTTCKDPWTNPDTHADGTVEAMSTRLEERGANAAFAGMIEKYLSMVLPTASVEQQPRFAVLDLGTGTGVVIRACAARLQKNGIPGDNVRLHGLDISEKLLAQARRLDTSNSITWTKLDPADGGRLPYADGEFDVIVMHTLLSHVTDPVSTLRDAARCLKKRDGRLVVFDADHAGTVYGLPDFQKMMDTNLKLAVAIATQVQRVTLVRVFFSSH
jgi:ubiquinone/menaquinone biosynthesis C-methylase UbiE